MDKRNRGIWVKNAGQWTEVLQPKIPVNQTWQDVKTVHTKVNGKWEKVWPSSGTATYNRPGTYTFKVPGGIYSMTLNATGAGGGGGLGSGYYSGEGGGGGGSGGYTQNQVIPVTPGETITITVGGGGLGGAAASQNVGQQSPGEKGGDTIIVTKAGRYSFTGGLGGVAGSPTAPISGSGGVGGDGTGGGFTGDGGGGCFLPGTLVTMSDGTKKPIQDIRAGDYVLEALTNLPTKVLGVKTREHDTAKWIFSLDKSVDPYITEEHPWYNDKLELCAMSTLCVEQAPWLGDVKIVKVPNKKKISQPVTVYNLMLETGESHYANDVPVNNIIKTGTAYVLFAKGFLSKAAYENYVYNSKNKNYSPERQIRYFNAFYQVSKYVLENDNWRGKTLAVLASWVINNRTVFEPIAKWAGPILNKVVMKFLKK